MEFIGESHWLCGRCSGESGSGHITLYLLFLHYFLNMETKTTQVVGHLCQYRGFAALYKNSLNAVTHQANGSQLAEFYQALILVVWETCIATHWHNYSRQLCSMFILNMFKLSRSVGAGRRGHIKRNQTVWSPFLLDSFSSLTNFYNHWRSRNNGAEGVCFLLSPLPFMFQCTHSLKLNSQSGYGCQCWFSKLNWETPTNEWRCVTGKGSTSMYRKKLT